MLLVLEVRLIAGTTQVHVIFREPSYSDELK